MNPQKETDLIDLIDTKLIYIYLYCIGILVGEVLGRRGGKSKSRENLCSGAGAMCSKEVIV